MVWFLMLNWSEMGHTEAKFIGLWSWINFLSQESIVLGMACSTTTQQLPLFFSILSKFWDTTHLKGKLEGDNNLFFESDTPLRLLLDEDEDRCPHSLRERLLRLGSRGGLDMGCAPWRSNVWTLTNDWSYLQGWRSKSSKVANSLAILLTSAFNFIALSWKS